MRVLAEIIASDVSLSGNLQRFGMKKVAKVVSRECRCSASESVSVFLESQ